jgi:four helix bundle suffix protein
MSKRAAQKWWQTFSSVSFHQTNYLLDQLIRKLEKDFLVEGGLRERMTRARLAHRAKQKCLGYS